YFNLDAVEPHFAHRIPWDLLTRDTVKIPVLIVVLSGLFATLLFRPRRMAGLGVAVATLTFCDLLVTSGHVLRLGCPAILKPDSAVHNRMIPKDALFRFDPSNGGNSYEDPGLYAFGPESLLGFWPAANGAFRFARATPFTLAHFKAVETVLLDPATS